MRSIALIGRARSGKDSVAEVLVREHNYTRVAFADPLKEMALRVNPWVVYSVPGFFDDANIRLSELVEHLGWERAKDEYPEVRRLLQQMGQTVRGYSPDFWLNIAVDKMRGLPGPWVVTDCRYRNEADALRARGFHLVRLVRPETEPLALGADLHPSETELGTYEVDQTFMNVGALSDLQGWAGALPYAP